MAAGAVAVVLGRRGLHVLVVVITVGDVTGLGVLLRRRELGVRRPIRPRVHQKGAHVFTAGVINSETACINDSLCVCFCLFI